MARERERERERESQGKLCFWHALMMIVMMTEYVAFDL